MIPGSTVKRFPALVDVLTHHGTELGDILDPQLNTLSALANSTASKVVHSTATQHCTACTSHKTLDAAQ